MASLDQSLIDAAISTLKARFPKGRGGAAAAYTEKENLLTSVGLTTANASANLCRETGAILEAVKLNEKIVAIACVYRESEEHEVIILSPCGICQERLMVWGGDMEVAVPDETAPMRWAAKPLRAVQPHYWALGLPHSVNPS